MHIFGKLSLISFERSMKTIMNQLVTDYRKLKDEELEVLGYRVSFFKYMKIFPKDILMASHVVSLLDNILSAL